MCEGRSAHFEKNAVKRSNEKGAQLKGAYTKEGFIKVRLDHKSALKPNINIGSAPKYLKGTRLKRSAPLKERSCNEPI